MDQPAPGQGHQSHQTGVEPDGEVGVVHIAIVPFVAEIFPVGGHQMFGIAKAFAQPVVFLNMVPGKLVGYQTARAAIKGLQTEVIFQPHADDDLLKVVDHHLIAPDAGDHHHEAQRDGAFEEPDATKEDGGGEDGAPAPGHDEGGTNGHPDEDFLIARKECRMKATNKVEQYGKHQREDTQTVGIAQDAREPFAPKDHIPGS